MITGIEIKNRSYDHEHTPIRILWFVIRLLELNLACLYTKIGNSSFSSSIYIVGAQQKLNGSRDLTMSLSGTVCHLWDTTCYDQPVYQI